MNTKIDGYKQLLNRITTAQNVQFHREAAAIIAPLTTKVSGIVPAFNTYKADADNLDGEFNKRTKSIETAELAALDEKRDATTIQIITRIGYHARYPANDTEKEFSRKMQFVADKYKDAPRKSYQSETSYLRNMIAELRQNADGLTLFGLTSMVDILEQENNNFETIYLARTGEKEAKRERGTLGELSIKANTSFDIVSQIINGVVLMSLNAATKTALEEVIGLMNGQIHQYNTVYHRHAGKIKKKKDDGTGADDEVEIATEE